MSSFLLSLRQGVGADLTRACTGLCGMGGYTLLLRSPRGSLNPKRPRQGGGGSPQEHVVCWLILSGAFLGKRASFGIDARFGERVYRSYLVAIVACCWQLRG